MQELKDKMNTMACQYIDSPEFEKHLEKTIQGTINSSVENCFRSYGDIAKNLEKAIQDKMKIDFSQVEIPELTTMVIKIAQAKIAEVLNEQAAQKLGNILSETLAPAPKEITVQEIVDLIIADIQENGDVEADHATVKIETSDYGVDLKIWKGETTRKSYSSYSSDTKLSPDVDLYIHKDSKKIRIIRNLDERRTFGTCIYGYEAKLYLMFCAGTIVTDILECDADDLNTSIREYD